MGGGRTRREELEIIEENVLNVQLYSCENILVNTIPHVLNTYN